MSRGSSVHIPFVLGFGTLLRSAPRAARFGSDGYPPYDIERISATDGASARLRITLAVAGFSVERLEIVEQAGQLTIRGRSREDRGDEGERAHLHRGIAARQFQRVFLLGEAMRVTQALLERGLLSIELSPETGDDERPAPGSAQKGDA